MFKQNFFGNGSCGMIPYTQGTTAYQGNKIFTMSTSDVWGANLEYLYVARAGTTELWRELVFW